MIPISNRLRDFMGFDGDYSEKQISKILKERLSLVCKPCWELRYCPYGPLVEDFPLPPLTKNVYNEHISYLKRCIESGYMGDSDLKVPLSEEKRKMFEEEILEEPDYVVEQISPFEVEASCKEFGHLCPAYFASEPFTETKESRKMSRSIPNSTIIRVARRDNNTCQICGRILLDREIEIDHIIPFARGGSTTENNLRVTCIECNRKKSDKLDFLHE